MIKIYLRIDGTLFNNGVWSAIAGCLIPSCRFGTYNIEFADNRLVGLDIMTENLHDKVIQQVGLKYTSGDGAAQDPRVG